MVSTEIQMTGTSTAGPSRRRRTTRAWLRLLAGLPLILVILVIWQVAVTRKPIFFLPAPTQIFTALKTEWFSGPPSQLFLNDQAILAITQTFGTALVGWVIASVLGITIGAVLGTRRALATIADPPLLLLRSIPPISIIPIAIVIMGLGAPMRVTVIVAGCIWPILLNSSAAVAGVDQVLRDVASLNRLNPIKTFWRVLLPAASPKLFAGLRLALSTAIVLSVGADMFSGSGGLGGALLEAQNTFNVPDMWATLVLIAVSGAIVNGLLAAAEKYALRWNFLGDKR